MTRVDAQQYLARFGWLAAPHSAGLKADAGASSALRRFQEFYGLPVDGTVNTATAAFMARPRCGVPDVPAERRGFVLNENGPYDHRALTYKFDSYLTDLTAGIQNAAFADACSKWAAVTDLTFTLITPAPVEDTDIMVSANPVNPDGALAVTFEDASMVFYDDWTWQVTPVSPGSYDYTQTAIHEIGHALGLDHSPVPTAIMYATTGDGDQPHDLDADDIAGIRALYPEIAPPSPPSAPTVTATGLATQIFLHWSPVPGADLYQVRKSAAQSGPWDVAGPSRRYGWFHHVGLSPCTTWYYVVQAINDDGVSDSNVVSASTLCGSPPAAPAATMLHHPSVHDRVLIGTPSTSEVTSYEVAEADSASGPFLVAREWGLAMTDSQRGGSLGISLGIDRRHLVRSEWYANMVRSPDVALKYFVLRTRNAYGVSPDSNVVSATG